MSCSFPQCTCPATHDMHLLGEPGSPYGMRVSRGRSGSSVTLWLPDGVTLTRRQPDAIRQLRLDVREYEARMEVLRQREAAEDRTDAWAKERAIERVLEGMP